MPPMSSILGSCQKREPSPRDLAESAWIRGWWLGLGQALPVGLEASEGRFAQTPEMALRQQDCARRPGLKMASSKLVKKKWSRLD